MEGALFFLDLFFLDLFLFLKLFSYLCGKHKNISMETQTQTHDFELTNALAVIVEDSTLLGLLKDKTDLTPPILMTTAKNGLLSDELADYIEDIFNKIIVNRKSYMTRYRHFSTNGVERKTKPVKKVEKTSETKTGVPRRYGKDSIDVDIKEQGGKATEIQLAMLALNDLKNLTANLQKRGVNDIFIDKGVIDGDKKLSSVDCRNIIATVETVMKKLKPILNGKRK